jgi:tRNA dimethylallyltransferase
VADPTVVAVLRPTATSKSALALLLAERYGGEIINCDSTAVYRRSTSAPTNCLWRSAAAFGTICSTSPGDHAVYRRPVRARCAAAIRDIHARGKLPLVVGGTGLYYRALTRGLFPGPAGDERMRGRLEAIALRRDVQFLHRMLARVDPASAQRVQPRDLKRIVRALEVFFLTGTPMTAHFETTRSPIEGMRIVAIGLRLPAEETSRRVTARVDRQFESGLLDEIRATLASGVPEDAQPFGGLVYRQALEHLHGIRDEAATRALIARRISVTRGVS